MVDKEYNFFYSKSKIFSQEARARGIAPIIAPIASLSPAPKGAAAQAPGHPFPHYLHLFLPPLPSLPLTIHSGSPT